MITIGWGSTFIATKIGLEDCSPGLYTLIRYAISLFLALIVFGRRFFPINRRYLLSGVTLGLMLGVGIILQIVGLNYTTVSKSSFITGTTVIFTPFAHFLIERKTIGLWQILSVLVAIPGLWLFTNPDFNNINIGDLLTVFSAICWAFYITYMGILTVGRDSLKEIGQMVTMQFVFVLPVAVLYFLIFEAGSVRFNLTDNLIYSCLFNGMLASFFLTIIHTAVQKYTTPTKAAIIFTLEPIVATTLAIFILNELLGTREYFGGAVLMLAVVFSEFGEIIFQKTYNLFFIFSRRQK